MSISTESCHREIVELHAFFQDWFNGTIPESGSAFDQFTAGMAESFTMRMPGGERFDHDSIIERVRGAYGYARESGPVKIWIENIRTVESGEDRAVIEYEEWQTDSPAAPPRGRRSVATFETDANVPNGVAWVDLHEEWL